jgi:glutamate carboxypeptidase
MQPFPDALAAACRAQEAPMLALIEELVAINSFTANPEGGAAVGAILARELGAIPGLDVALLDSETYAPHLVAKSAPAAGCVALVGHLDTVFPPGTFEGFRRDGAIARGPGVLDMKGGLVTALFALRLAAGAGALPPVRFVIVSDEEVGSPEGAGVLEAELRGASCALVFEAGRAHDAIITARKGTGGIRARGPLAAVARFVDRAQSLTDHARGVTVSAGTISGDAEAADALFDLRFVTTADAHALEAALRELAIDVELGGGIARSPLERTADNAALAREYGEHAQAAGLGGGEAGLIGGGSDASTTAALGIPSIDGLGPRGTGFHTEHELIEIATLTQRLEALARFLWRRATTR